MRLNGFGGGAGLRDLDLVLRRAVCLESFPSSSRLLRLRFSLCLLDELSTGL